MRSKQLKVLCCKIIYGTFSVNTFLLLKSVKGKYVQIKNDADNMSYMYDLKNPWTQDSRLFKAFEVQLSKKGYTPFTT